MKTEVVKENKGIDFSFFQHLFACLQSMTVRMTPFMYITWKDAFFKDGGQVLKLVVKTIMRMNPIRSSSKYDKR